MAGEKKINGYVKRYFKHQALVQKYAAKLEKLKPLKRKMDAAEIDMKIKRQTLTGGEMHRATTIIVQQMKATEAMAGFNNRHED